MFTSRETNDLGTFFEMFFLEYNVSASTKFIYCEKLI